MTTWTQLQTIRAAYTGARCTTGLADAVIQRFLATDEMLSTAMGHAHAALPGLQHDFADLFSRDETQLINDLQSDFLNFYAHDARSPYIPIGACGPWIITHTGAVVHDSGGYGMLGFGHNPESVLAALSTPQAMANIMTPSVSQRRCAAMLKREVGHRRAAGFPYDALLMMNSGSEAMSVATRIVDAYAKIQTDPGAAHHGKQIKSMTLEKSFHGRTGRPARVSDSTRKYYAAYLASYRDDVDRVLVVPPNDIAALDAAFTQAAQDKVFISACYCEPVQGEGSPGLALTPAFYKRARALTTHHDALLIIDSIQAGIRTQGVLSLTDYPGFESLEPPDMESFSKALNAGQYPVSVLVMNNRAKAAYHKGLYGNTMTAAPRACDVASAVLEALTDDIRRNIVDRGHEFLDKLQQLADRHPGTIAHIRGTGLLISAQLVDAISVEGQGGLEERLRQRGINVIHGGHNALRFTPHFRITSTEIDLMMETLGTLLAG
jgi:acetylornithine/succinyldiaminopimelate/putrescine aminotransferase